MVIVIDEEKRWEIDHSKTNEISNKKFGKLLKISKKIVKKWWERY